MEAVSLATRTKTSGKKKKNTILAQSISVLPQAEAWLLVSLFKGCIFSSFDKCFYCLLLSKHLHYDNVE